MNKMHSSASASSEKTQSNPTIAGWIVRLSYLLVIAMIFILSGCASQPYDYSALIESKPKTLLVLPPINHSIEVNAPYTFLSTISRPLAEKGYYVLPVAVIDRLMKENGLPTPAEMHQAPLDKIREHTGADAVLYVVIHEWGQKYQVLSSATIVKADMKLIDTQTGTQLWGASIFAQESSSDSQNGIVGALVNAVITQVAGSIVDHTPRLSRNANYHAIQNSYRGLLDGPYKLEGQSVETAK